MRCFKTLCFLVALVIAGADSTESTPPPIPVPARRRGKKPVFVRVGARTITVDTADTVDTLHAAIHENTGIPQDSYWLSIAGKPLKDGCSLQDCNIQEGATIDVNLRLPGGAIMKLLFCGNPGSGKSTLMNIHAGVQMAKSGTSYGGGLTFELDTHKHNGIIYEDTPGLDDPEIRTKAAEAISTALKEGGPHKVFFVVTQQHGRVLASDKTTMKKVLTACPEIVAGQYGVIVNQCDDRIVNDMSDREGPAYKRFTTCLFGGIDRITEQVLFLPSLGDLYSKDNAMVPIDNLPGLKEFMDKCPVIDLTPGAADNVDPNGYDDMVEKMEAQQREYKKLEQAKKDADAAAAVKQAELEQAKKDADAAAEEQRKAAAAAEQERIKAAAAHDKELKKAFDAAAAEREKAAADHAAVAEQHRKVAADAEQQRQAAADAASAAAEQMKAQRAEHEKKLEEARKSNSGGDFWQVLGDIATLGITAAVRAGKK